MKLSNNFYLSELTKSEIASRLDLDNTPSQAVTTNLQFLAEKILQPVRDHYKVPVIINSGYRSPAVNEATKGSKTSQHMTGEAADFEIPGVDNKDLAKWIKGNLVFDQLILEFYKEGDSSSGWVHCSYSPVKKRHSVLTASIINGKTVYTEGII
jgi:hypothetical protein